METKVISVRVGLGTSDRVDRVANHLYQKNYKGVPNRTEFLSNAINLFCNLGEAGILDGINLSQIDLADFLEAVALRKVKMPAPTREWDSLKAKHNTERLNMTDLKKIVESNAKAIAALTSDISEMKRDRDLMYSNMRDLTDKISTLVGVQTQSYDLMKNLDDRQGQLSNQQDQIIQILKSLSEK